MRRASRRIWRPDGHVSSRVAHRSGGPFVMVPCPCRSIVPGRAWGGGQPAPPPRFIHRVYLKLSGVRSAGAMAWPEALPKQKWGPALLPAPTCTELRICRCSLAWWLSPPALRSWLTSSGVASDRGPARRLVLDLPRPFLGWSLSRRLLPGGAANCDWKTNSSGASSGGPTWAEALLIAIRWRSVLPSPAAPSCRCRPSDEAGTSVPITHVSCTTFSSRESEKNESLPVDNGDIVHNSSQAKRVRRAVADSFAPT
jgi:hypothetical protein